EQDPFSYRQKSAEEIRLRTVPPITDATPRARINRLERVGIGITAVLQPRVVEDEFANRGANVGNLRRAHGGLEKQLIRNLFTDGRVRSTLPFVKLRSRLLTALNLP